MIKPLRLRAKACSLVILFVFTPGVTQAMDLAISPYQRPLTLELDPANDPVCIRVYRVSRPVAPFVHHLFVGAEISHLKDGRTTLALFGAPKGASDEEAFRRALAGNSKTSLSLKGQACGDSAMTALEVASATSEEWHVRLENSAYFVGRMVFTPVLGRICREAADQVLSDIRPYLR